MPASEPPPLPAVIRQAGAPTSDASFWTLKPGQPFGRYLLRIWALTFFPALVIAIVLEILGAAPRGPKLGAGPEAFFGVVVLAPIVETLLLAATLFLCGRFTRQHRQAAVAAAAIWAVLHSLAWPTWGLIIAWPFYVWSRVYLGWRPLGLSRALGVTALIHAAHNFVPGVILLF